MTFKKSTSLGFQLKLIVASLVFVSVFFTTIISTVVDIREDKQNFHVMADAFAYNAIEGVKIASVFSDEDLVNGILAQGVSVGLSYVALYGVNNGIVGEYVDTRFEYTDVFNEKITSMLAVCSDKYSWYILSDCHEFIIDDDSYKFIVYSDYDVAQLFSGAIYSGSIVFILMTLLMIPLTSLAFRVVTKPLEMVSVAMKTISKNRNYNTYVKGEFSGEIGELVRVFNVMVQQIRQSSQVLSEYKYALDTAAMLCVTDINGSIVNVNKNLCSKLDVNDEDVVGRNFSVLKMDADSRSLLGEFWLSENIKPEVKRILVLSQTGEEVWCDATVVVLDNNEGARKYLVIFMDVTDQIKSQIELHKSTLVLTSVLDAIPVSVFWKDINGVYLGCNQRFVDDAGLESVEDIVGKTDHDMPWKENAEEYINDDAEVIRSGNPKLKYDEPQTVDGNTIWIETNKLPLVNKDAEVVGVLGAYQDITERKNTEISLLEARNQLEVKVAERTDELASERDRANLASASKTEFLSRMSHELRTPMNAILGFSQLLDMDIDESMNDDHKKYVQEIMRAGNHLLDLINEVLDISRIDAGKIDMSLECVELSTLLDEVNNLISPLAQINAITVEFMPVNEEVTIVADRMRMKQVLINLLSNAVKYNCKGGMVRIAYSMLDDNYVRISVTDTGKGIADDKRDEVFGEFNRLGVTSEEIEGTGIGLSITRRLIEIMGGRIDFESREGVGSTFWVDVRTDFMEHDNLNAG